MDNMESRESSEEEKEREKDSIDHVNSSAGTMCMDVKSTAVVKCSAVQAPARYLQLSSNTDLNQPPSNWLRNNVKWQGRWGQWSYPRSHSTMFSSFHLAHNFPDCVGEVDVISDSENIKKLLKIPYSKSHVSMMVHCVGKTLLIDEFDIHSHLLRASQKQWEWLKKFFKEHVLQSLQQKEKVMLRKNKSRDYLQNKNMFSKFLYYSIAGGSSSEDLQQDAEKEATDNTESSYDTNRPVTPVKDYTVNIPDSEKDEEEQTNSETQEFVRNVLWTFEDIRMLIGSDMPIFGGGTHPAVSLKLRDMQKPINVLTGLDYWLDNLMCNVPEVVMCYHLNGIVQKYEFIKTKDIPQMKNSQFSTNVVRDIAQNILSFLKSNATKSGHTYWLFKGKNDDVVKLYDLTTLCSDIMDDKEQNPFTLPVAMLLYRVARNMMESADGCQKQKTIYKLLKNCLVLLDSKRHPKIVTSVHYLLSNIYIPSNIDLSTIHEFLNTDDSESSDDVSGNPSDDDDDDDDNDDDDDDESESDNNDNIMSVDVKALCLPHMLERKKYKKTEKNPYTLTKNWEERCNSALSHIIKGIHCVLKSEEEEKTKEEADTNQNKQQEGPEVKVANPFQPIPLRYSPLNISESAILLASKYPNDLNLQKPSESERKKTLKSQPENSSSESSSDTSAKKNHITSLPTNDDSWTIGCKILLLRKAVEIYCGLAEICSEKKEFGRTLKNIKMGILCYECANFLAVNHSSKWPCEFLALMLELAGDAHFMIVHNEYPDQQAQKGDFESLSAQDSEMLDVLAIITGEEVLEGYKWTYEWPADLEASLNLSAKCYELAQKILSDKKGSEFERLTKRWGNICNELGVFYMNQAARLYNDKGTLTEKVTEQWKKSASFLECGIKAFQYVSDIANVALLYSNTGRLMRLWAHAYVPLNENGSRKEFSLQERKYYEKAISNYSDAVQVLGNRSRFPEIWDTVNWELSTTLFTMASLLQDYAPLSAFVQEEVEKEVNELMMKSLKLCDLKEVPSAKHAVYQYRMATIHHRLGSLYHNSYRNQISSDSRRKQMRTLADLHYVKACTLFSTLEHSNEFLHALLERIGLWEHHLSGLTGFGSKVKVLSSILEYMITSKPMLAFLISKNKTDVQKVTNDNQEQSDDDDECTEQDRLLKLFEQRIQVVLKTLVKCYSNKTSKHKELFKKWESVYNAFLQSSSDTPLHMHLYSIIEKMESVLQNS